jgi:ubiquinone/menaquinone biosynthesis C-methylase UbiE
MDEKTIAEVKNYWNSRPCNIRHSSKPVGSEEYFNEVEARKYFVEPNIPVFAEFPKWKGKKVLEIGCGIGTDTISFLRAGASVTAVELSEESLALAKKRAEVFGFSDRVKFYLANAEQLSDVLPVETYDLVYSFGVIHHTPHPEKVMAEIKKYLKPGGTVKIMVYNFFSWKVLWMVIRFGQGQFWKARELVPKYSEAQIGSPVTFSYTKKDIGQRLLGGFTITDMFVDHIFPYKFPEYKNYIYKKVWYFRYLPNWFFRWMERHFGWHLCVTAIKN